MDNRVHHMRMQVQAPTTIKMDVGTAGADVGVAHIPLLTRTCLVCSHPRRCRLGLLWNSIMGLLRPLLALNRCLSSVQPARTGGPENPSLRSKQYQASLVWRARKWADSHGGVGDLMSRSGEMSFVSVIQNTA